MSGGFCLHAVNTKVIFDFGTKGCLQEIILDNLSDFQKIVNLTVKIV